MAQSSHGNMIKTAGLELSISSAVITAFSETVSDPSWLRISFRLSVRDNAYGSLNLKLQKDRLQFRATVVYGLRMRVISADFV